MDGPVTQGFLLAVKDELKKDAKAGHDRLRQSVNELTAEVTRLHDQVVIHVAEHQTSEKLHREQREDGRDRVALLSIVTSAATAFLLFVLKLLWEHL
jgi:hypothetical protein